VIQRAQDILLNYRKGTTAFHEGALATVYLLQFVVSGRSIPACIQRRWKEVGVLTKDGFPNAAIESWAKHLFAGDEPEGVLTEILLVLSCVYDEGAAWSFEAGEDVGSMV